MGIITDGIKKGIKTMCVVSQTAQFISLMPKPEDFVIRVVGDIVYLSTQVKELSDKMNKLLDSYAEIPGNYLMTQMNSITGSLSSITNRVNTFTQSAINESLGLAENTMNSITDLTGVVIDTAGSAVDAVVGLGNVVAMTGSYIGGNVESAEDINDATEVILEWSKDGFEEYKEEKTQKLKDATQKVKNAKEEALGKVNDVANNVNEEIESAQKKVEDLIKKLHDWMKELEKKIDGVFTKEGEENNDSGSFLDKLEQATKDVESDNQTSQKVVQAVNSSVSALNEVIKNFSIGKLVTAFGGILVQTTIVRLGLDQLPPIDFEAMLCELRDSVEKTPEDLYREYQAINKELDELYECGEDGVEIPSEERTYNPEKYNEFKRKYENELQEQRSKIRNMMKFTSNKHGDIVDKDGKVINGSVDTTIERNLRSAIHEARKLRRQAKNAKQATTWLKTLGNELDNFKKEAEYRFNSVKSDWHSMMKQYKDSIKEIKSFFTTGGSCDMYIDDVCDDINQCCDNIKDLCKNLGEELICCTIKVAMPADIGTVVPNPVYKISDFWMDIKTIFVFIKKLIENLLRIINDINKLARLMLNGLNNLKEIITQLMDLIGLKWLMDLIQGIIDLFSDNISNARLKLENTLSPVHFSDTDEYNNALEAFDEIIENQSVNGTNSEYLADAMSLLETIKSTLTKKEQKNLNELSGKVGDVRNMKKIKNNDLDDISEIVDELEEWGERIIAYKSPILEETGSPSNVSDLMEGGTFDNDIKFIGWHFFHPTLDHTNNTYYGNGLIDKIIKRIKSKIIKKASKTGSKKNGGVNKLRKKKVGWKKKIDTAYVAFYWYTYYTEDLEKDCFERTATQGGTIIDSVIQTQNGSIVEIVDANGVSKKVFVANNMVKSGDYVVVEGIKYRVK